MLEKVLEIIAEQLSKDAKDLKIENRIIEDLGADSLDVVDLVMAIEENFDIEVPDDKVETLKTIEDIARFVAAETGEELDI